MTKYLTGVLSVIAVGVVLIAYGLLSPRATALSYSNQNPFAAQATYADGSPGSFAVRAGAVPCSNDMQMTYPYGNASLGNALVVNPVTAQPVRTVAVVDRTPVARRTTAVRTVARAPRRDWKKTALVVGGSTATAAGIGALVGGGKGALVGAALGGGLSTLYETTKGR
ncbi:MAG TPA: hypothetical protein VF456_04190 [Vicinamibacterales bacterium]